jgi:hypothetical protein
LPRLQCVTAQNAAPSPPPSQPSPKAFGEYRGGDVRRR